MVKKISDLPPMYGMFAYMQEFSKKKQVERLKRIKGTKYFKIQKDKKPSWYVGKWRQTYTLVPK